MDTLKQVMKDPKSAGGGPGERGRDDLAMAGQSAILWRSNSSGWSLTTRRARRLMPFRIAMLRVRTFAVYL